MQEDEYNLLYVAATRPKLALVCNEDVSRLLHRGEASRPLLVQVGGWTGGGGTWCAVLAARVELVQVLVQPRQPAALLPCVKHTLCTPPACWSLSFPVRTYHKCHDVASEHSASGCPSCT